MSWSDPCSNCGEHRADCQCGDWNGYKKAEEEKKKEVFDAHIGISPSQHVHVRKYHSAICSACTTAINFKINQIEFEKLEKMLHTKTLKDE